MNRGWIAFAALLALLIAAGLGFLGGRHVTELAWHKADADRLAADYLAATREEIRAHATDVATGRIALDLTVQLGQLQVKAAQHQEETRHALATLPPAADFVVPAGLVRLRAQQSQASAAIAAKAAQLVDRARLSATGQGSRQQGHPGAVDRHPQP